MDTPICDFVRAYAQSDSLRLHMPGHKGVGSLGVEKLDITEIPGADSLYEADGIIAKSEENAGTVFGCRTYYSTEGSSQCIRGMLYLLCLYAKKCGKKPVIAAFRNVHKSFLTAAGLLDVQVQWLYSARGESYLSCGMTAEALGAYLQAAAEKPVALYLTSPDYLGMTADIAAIARVCHQYGVVLAVDNAHGAYLKFLPASMHPMDLGADICCDSAHKTLPVLTGGAYLHLAPSLAEAVGDQAKNALMLFGSTSPSYLILQSLDMFNANAAQFAHALQSLLPRLDALKSRLQKHGYVLRGNEPLKLTIYTKPYGYLGTQLAELLRQEKIEPEFADPDYLVLMLSTKAADLDILQTVLCRMPAKAPITEPCPVPAQGTPVMPIREAMLAPSQQLPTGQCLGKILAVPTVGCPPAVPILVCGEQIDEQALSCFAYYGIQNCCVVKAEDQDA